MKFTSIFFKASGNIFAITAKITICFVLQKHIKSFYDEEKEYSHNMEHNIKLLSIFVDHL